MSIKCTDHFRERVLQRLPGVDPEELAGAFYQAVSQAHSSVEYLGRSRGYTEVSGRRRPNKITRRFRYFSPPMDAPFIMVVFDTKQGMCCLTTYPEGEERVV